MEQWQVEHITKNLTELITLTRFNCIVEARLVENNILNRVSDVDWLKAQKSKDGVSEACKLYYEKLMSRADAYKVLYNALVETNQSGAARILVRVPPERFSKPLTYLGISTEVNEFQNVQIEVNGKSVKLQEFFPQADYKVVQRIFHETIPEVDFYDSFVIKIKKFVLSKDTIPPKPSHYIPRFLSNRIKLDQYIFITVCSDVFVFKNSIPRYKLSQIARPNFTADSSSQLTNITCRFIHLEDYEHWTVLKKKCKKVPIHLINYEAEENQFILEDSSEPSDILRKLKYQKERGRFYISEDKFVQQQISKDCGSSSLCICDTPGMGKTLLLENVARLMAERCTERIILFIKLTAFAKDCIPATPNAISQPETSLINVLRFTCLPNQNPELLLELVKAKLLSLHIFFDGFDELPTEKVGWTTKVFRLITTFPMVRIYVTSRPHMRQDLENGLGVIAYDILPFNQQNQVEFLVQFWQRNKTTSDQCSLQSVASSCLEAVNESVTSNDKEIAGIPLLCQLIAEVYVDKVTTHSFKRRKFCDVPLKLFGMYQNFIEKKLNLVAINRQDFENIKLFHIWYGLKLLFPTKNFHEDNRFSNVKGLLTSPEVLRTGILQKYSNEVLEFIHRTFAEYIVAEYFSVKLQDDEMPKTEISNFSSRSMLKLLLECQEQSWRRYKFQHPVIVSFLNSALDEVNISEEMKTHGAAFISSTSQKEFKSLFVACCQHNLFNIFSFLGASLTKLTNFSILDFFPRKNCYELLKVCIEVSTSQMFHSCIQLFTEVFKMDVALINGFHDISYTLLEIAARCANYEAVEYFIDMVSFKKPGTLEECVQFCDNIEKRENILNLLHSKYPTLVHDNRHILLMYVVDVRLFKMLVEFGANLTTVDTDGNNCAMHIAEYMSPSDFHESVQFLLTKCKAEYLFLKNGKWKDPIPYIIRCATLLPATLELLLNIPGIDINVNDEDGENLLFSAVKGYKLNNLQQLVDRGLDYSARGTGNRSLLHVATQLGQDVEMVQYLLSLKSDPDSRDEREWTPLHYAAEVPYGSLSVIEVLVENGANVQAKNSKAQTALHLTSAAEKYFPNIKKMKYLIEKGAEVNNSDNDGNTPLHLCKKNQGRNFLIEMGADRNAKNKMGQTPEQMNPDLWKSTNTASVLEFEVDSD